MIHSDQKVISSTKNSVKEKNLSGVHKTGHPLIEKEIIYSREKINLVREPYPVWSTIEVSKHQAVPIHTPTIIAPFRHPVPSKGTPDSNTSGSPGVDQD